MDERLLQELDPEKLNSPYETAEELLEDYLSLLDHRLFYFYKYHQWLGPDSKLKDMLGLVVSREEFEHHITDAACVSLEEQMTEEEADELLLDESIIACRLENTDQASNALLQVFSRFGMDSFRQNCFILALAPLLDVKYEKIFAYLQDDIAKKRATMDLAAKLYLSSGQKVWNVDAFKGEDPFLSLFTQEGLDNGTLIPETAVVDFIKGRLPEEKGFSLITGEEMPAECLLHQKTADQLDSVFAGGPAIVILQGEKGTGKHFQAEQCCIRHRLPCVSAELGKEEALQKIRKAGMLSRLLSAGLILKGLTCENADGSWKQPEDEVFKAIGAVMPENGRMFLITEGPLHFPTAIPKLECKLEKPEIPERLMLFQHVFRDVPAADDFDPAEAATKFHFMPGQICHAAEEAKGLAAVLGRELTNAEIHECCYHQAVHNLDQLATRLKPAYSWDELILPGSMKTMLQQACAHIRFSHRVYDEWGYARRIPYGRGLSLLFDGPPGTGKTMCARIMASELNMEMYKINISQIVSKYIGETEKNLQTLFKEAKNADCILFFDECDALFGKRSDVKDSHDKNANVETAYLLQQIEEYDGVCILATNLLKNIDEAFLRRITYVLHFPFPDADMREEIYRNTVTPGTPLDSDIDWRVMAEKFPLSGGYIKNIVLSAAFRAARENVPMNMRHLINCGVNELRKNEIVVVRENLKEYGDLLDD